MSFCRNCGKEVDDGAKFCAGCGAATEAAADAPVTTTMEVATNSFSDSSSNPASALSDANQNSDDPEEWDIKKLSNKWAWCLAFVPLMGYVLNIITAAVVVDPVLAAIAVKIMSFACIPLFVLFYMLDNAELNKRNIKFGWGWMLWGILLCGFVVGPIYLFSRAKKIGKYGYAIASLVVALVVLVLPLAGFSVFSEIAKLADSTPVQLDSTETAQSAAPTQQNNTGSAPAESRDSRLVNAKGWCWYSTRAYSLTLESNGTASRTHIAELYEEGETTAETGTWSTNGNKITLILDGARETFTYSISGTTLYLGDTEYTKMKEDDITYWDD